MSVVEELLVKNEGNKRAAAFDLCVGVMSFSPADPLRQGYTIGNALIMAAEFYDLTATEVAVLADRLVAPLVEAAEGVRRMSHSPLSEALERFGIAP